MKPSDLRIGNLVYYHLTEDICDVNYIGENSFDCKTSLGSMSHGIYDPIELTEEWLLKFGFIVDESQCEREAKIYSIQVSNNDSLYFDNNEWYISHEWDNNHFKNAFWQQPKYVHQLQNLYFSLTGEELTIR